MSSPPTNQRVAEIPRPAGWKNPILAGILSLLMPGLGQLYNNEVGKGFAFIAGFALTILLTMILIGAFIIPFLLGWAFFDAYRSAQRQNELLSRKLAA